MNDKDTGKFLATVSIVGIIISEIIGLVIAEEYYDFQTFLIYGGLGLSGVWAIVLIGMGIYDRLFHLYNIAENSFEGKKEQQILIKEYKERKKRIKVSSKEISSSFKEIDDDVDRLKSLKQNHFNSDDLRTAKDVYKLLSCSSNESEIIKNSILNQQNINEEISQIENKIKKLAEDYLTVGDIENYKKYTSILGDSSQDYSSNLVTIIQNDRLAKEAIRRNKLIVTVAISIALVIVVSIEMYNYIFVPNNFCNRANTYLKQHEFEKAEEQYAQLASYKNKRIKNEDSLLFTLSSYPSAKEIKDYFLEVKYQNALYLKEQFESTITENVNSSYYIPKITETINLFNEIIDYKDSKSEIKLCKEKLYSLALKSIEAGYSVSALEYCHALREFDDYYDKVNECMYEYVLSHKDRDNLMTYTFLCDLKKNKYENSSKLYDSLYKITMKAWIEKKGNGDRYLFFKGYGGPPNGEEITIAGVSDYAFYNPIFVFSRNYENKVNHYRWPISPIDKNVKTIKLYDSNHKLITTVKL